MPAAAPASPAEEFAVLLRGEVDSIAAWTESTQPGRLGLHALIIVLGAGLYGAAMGWARAPLQAWYTAVKLPLIMLLTATGNALLNAMLAPLLGLSITFRQSFLAMVMSFSIESAILGSFSPVVAFLIWNAPPLTAAAQLDGVTYSALRLLIVVVIGFAGTVANLRLWQLLVRWGGDTAVAGRVLFAWLAGNLLLGSQLAWILRPFIGSPLLPVEFVRDTALQGNFFENAAQALLQIFHS
jgi:hypothetical protein